MAVQAHVPIVPIAFDWGKKEVKIHLPYYATDSLRQYMDNHHRMCRCCGGGNDAEDGK